jgi:hypothetical protein
MPLGRREPPRPPPERQGGLSACPGLRFPERPRPPGPGQGTSGSARRSPALARKIGQGDSKQRPSCAGSAAVGCCQRRPPRPVPGCSEGGPGGQRGRNVEGPEGLAPPCAETEQSPGAPANEETPCSAGRWPSCAELDLRDQSWRAVTGTTVLIARTESPTHAGESVGLAGAAARPGAAAPSGWTKAAAAAASLGGRCGRIGHSAAPLHTRCGCPRRRRDLLRLHPPRRPTPVGAVRVGTQTCEAAMVLREHCEYPRTAGVHWRRVQALRCGPRLSRARSWAARWVHLARPL